MKGRINLDNLEEAVRAAPQHTNLFIGLSQIDKFVKQVIKDTIINHANDPDIFYIKTEIDEDCYVLSLFNSETEKIINHSWPLTMFLQLCKEKRIEFEMQKKTFQMIQKLTE